MLCVSSEAVRPYVAWEVVRAFLVANFSRTERNLRRLQKVTSLETRGARARALRMLKRAES